MKIVDHVLDDRNVEIRQTPNTSGPFQTGKPDTLVIHFTGGSSANSSANHLCKKDAKASAHLVIGRDGKIIQLAPFNMITWHAGKSSWKGRHGLNKFSIGIELDNAGELTDNGNGKYISWFNKVYLPDEVFHGIHRNKTTPSFWHAYTEMQIEKTFDVCRLICDHYHLREVVGHEEIAPERKSDPGPAFPLDRMREQLLTEDRKAEEAADDPFLKPESLIVNTSRLNIRNGPGTQFGLTAEPLLRGTVVKPIQSQSGWTEVEFTLKGWVSSQYIQPLGVINAA